MVRRETGKELIVEVYCSEGLAAHTGLRVMHHDPRGRGEAFTGERIGRDIEPRKGGSGCRRCRRSGRHYGWARYCECLVGSAWSKTLSMCVSSLHGNRETFETVRRSRLADRIGKARATSR